jgi:hypothetical protein
MHLQQQLLLFCADSHGMNEREKETCQVLEELTQEAGFP